jgi:hypothetical protein
VISRRSGIAAFFIVTTVVILATTLAPRVPQPKSYHLFADQRGWLGIPNFGDVVSNFPFAVFGISELWFVLAPANRERFHIDARERWPYAVGFFGLFLTAFGTCEAVTCCGYRKGPAVAGDIPMHFVVVGEKAKLAVGGVSDHVPMAVGG